MQPIDPRQPATITPHAGGHLVQVGDKTYYLTELQMSGASTLTTPRPIESPMSPGNSNDPYTVWVKLLAIASLSLVALLVAR